MGFFKVCGAFLLYGCCGQGFLYSIQSTTNRLLKRWRKRFVNAEERRNYITAEWQKILFVTIWVLLNFALFVEAGVRWLYRVHKAIDDATFLDPVTYKGYRQAEAWIFIARGFGQLLNFNCAMIMLPVMRTVLNVLRSLKFGVILPLDKNVIFHRYLAYWIVVCTVGHAFAHYMNYSCCHLLYKTSKGAAEKSSWTAAWANKFGLTGHLLTIVMVLMYSSATNSYRRSNNFTVFWYTHHLFVFFFTLLLIHGRNFWMWFLGPGALYILERMLRNMRGSTVTIVKRVTALPSLVVHLELEKPSFRYDAGQYCFVNCPLISRHEWHPFTISSAPEEEHLTFHIRCVGDWTHALKDLFVPTGKGTVVINKPTTPSGDSYLIRVDGPFGTAAEYVYDFEYVILVAAGIGVTPYASLLKHMRYQIRSGNAHFKVKRVFFYWINRDQGSWEWFSDMLDDLEDTNPEFFEIHTHMTGALKAEEVRAIIDTSSEYKGDKMSSGKLLARANYDYSPQASDEIELRRGDEVEIEEKDDSGWWKGTNRTTKTSGLFPSNYVSFVDSVTKMRTGKNRRFGRPDWHEEFGEIRKFVEQNTPNIAARVIRPSVGIFICGPSVLSKQLYKASMEESKNSSVNFKFHKENF